MRGGLETITESGAVLIGGHTVKDDELKYGLSVTGIVREKDITPNSGAKPGDLLILTKPIGTGVLLTASRSGRIDDATVLPVLRRMAQLNKTACELMIAIGVNGVTDVTGFGLGGHSWEMARASKIGIRFHDSKVPKWPMALELTAQGVKTGVTLSNGESVEPHVRFDDNLAPEAQMLYFDPQTSGGLLISVPEDKAETLLTRILNAGIEDAAICGEVFASETPHLEIVA